MKDVNMFGCPIRTNNDVEAFHHQLNSPAGRNNLQFYLLLQILQERAEMVPLTASLVRRACIYKFQRASTKSFQAHIISLWESYSGQGQFVTSHLGDNMASVTWATKVSTKWVDQIDQLTDIFKEVSLFVVWLCRFVLFAN